MSAWFSVAAKPAHQMSEMIKKEIENKTENTIKLATQGVIQ